MAWYWRCQGGYSSTGNTCKESGSLECNCTGAHLGIQVLCIYMTHLETVSIQYCVKRPVAEQRSEEHTSELQSHLNLVCRLLLEKKNKTKHEKMTNKHTISIYL